jgi:hypothetical protein
MIHILKKSVASTLPRTRTESGGKGRAQELTSGLGVDENHHKLQLVWIPTEATSGLSVGHQMRAEPPAEESSSAWWRQDGVAARANRGRSCSPDQ